MNIKKSMFPSMINVPEGLLIRGSDEKDSHSFQDEKTSERIVRVAGFQASVFPVTNENFRYFIDDRGYDDNDWWDDEGIEWKKYGNKLSLIDYWVSYILWLKEQDLHKLGVERGWRLERLKMYQELVHLSLAEMKSRSEDAFKRNLDRPAFWDDPAFNQPNQPVVGVNLFEANAYCNWLSAKTGGKYRLLSETEWEYAARGSDERLYPWGNSFDTDCCNTLESGIYKTTKVDMYPGGISPFGLYDMAGNVWEWTNDRYQPYPGNNYDSKAFKDTLAKELLDKLQVVRGGSWDNNMRYSRCSCRDKDIKDIFASRLGIRIAI